MFDRVVSLGWFCSPALEIKRIGLREASYPFDWLLSHDFSIVMQLIAQTSTIHLHDEEMLQYRDCADKWYNKRYCISIFHDFSKYEKMISQIQAVNEKYTRRCERFYKAICTPTLFLRYIKDKEELLYIEQNEDYIVQCLKKYHPDNEIVFVANRSLEAEYSNVKSLIYFVDADEGDYVARSFLEKAPKLSEYLSENVRKPATILEEQKQSVWRRGVHKLISKFKVIARNDSPIHKEGVLERAESKIVLFHEKSDCCGCGACAAICPKKAIRLELLDDFYYPSIEKEKCIECRQCIKICPF